MAYYNGKNILLNVNYKGNTHLDNLEWFDLNVNDSEAFPQLEISGFDDPTDYAEGKMIVAVPKTDVPMNGKHWYGDYLAEIKYFRQSTQRWVNTSNITGKTISAGTPMILWLKFDPDNFSFTSYYWLNPPIVD